MGHTCGPIAYMRLFGMISRDAIDGTRTLQLDALERRPAGIGFVLDASGDIPLPDADVRGYASEMARRHAAGLLVHVTLLEETGFRASLIRSALTGIFFVARTGYPQHVVPDLFGAQLALFRTLRDEAPSIDELRAEVQALRQASMTR